ncbi:MAG: hypothetical protein AAGB22_04630, partial [Bacteroidota bacterium]
RCAARPGCWPPGKSGFVALRPVCVFPGWCRKWLINCYSELDDYNRDRAYKQCEAIYDTTLEIHKLAGAQQIPTYRAANNLAEQRIEAIGRIKLPY